MADVSPEEKLLDVIKKQQGKMRLKKELKFFTKINFILVGLITLILIAFLIDIFTANHKTSKIGVDLSAQSEIILAAKDQEALYEEEPVAIEKPPISKEDMIKDLNLMGIITGDNNQAIIEDKKTSKTFFLYEGDILEEFKVYDIKESSVILDYKGEKTELKI